MLVTIAGMAQVVLAASSPYDQAAQLLDQGKVDEAIELLASSRMYDDQIRSSFAGSARMDVSVSTMQLA